VRAYRLTSQGVISKTGEIVSESCVFQESDGFRVKLWRGESMCLLGFDVEDPEDDFVGFAVEFQRPGDDRFFRLSNRLSFDDPNAVTGDRKFPTTEAPLQMFRWVHFDWQPLDGTYTYRVTKMHMPHDGQPLVPGTQITLPITLGSITIDGFLDIGFTRNFASSQAWLDLRKRKHIADDVAIIPDNADDGLTFAPEKVALDPTGIYDWLGFDAYRLMIDFLDQAIADPDITVDALAYDLNEPDVVNRLEVLGDRLPIIIDDSVSTPKDKPPTGHGVEDSVESQVATLLGAAGAEVHRGHFKQLQHNKVFIAKRGGAPIRVLGGSTNFSYRGFFIQANNLFVFDDPQIAELFAEMFTQAFEDMTHFAKSAIAHGWHSVVTDAGPTIDLCFSPHTSAELSLGRVGSAINDSTSSVFYAIAFLNQIKSGSVKTAIDDLVASSKFSYGIVDETGKTMKLVKPSGEVGVVDFAYLAKHAPEPFKSEWSGGGGINIHDKFVVVDFDQPDAKVFTGSSNFSPAGETGNGDHLIVINDQSVAVAYAIDALRMFDHLAFRDRMQTEKSEQPQQLRLKKPVAISGEGEPWFGKYYVAGTQRETDRLTFSRPPVVAAVPQ
jgi:hypothetical protein